MNLRLLLGGAKSYLPIKSEYRGTGGSVSTRYCYAVWLRHLVLCHKAGVGSIPSTLVEIGPGDTIGVGLAALLTGTSSYRGLDVLEHANHEANARILEELLALFARRESIPDNNEWPRLNPRLSDYRFPGDVLPDSLLEKSLVPERVARIRAAIPTRVGAANDTIAYVCPWSPTAVEKNSTDMVLSQVALQDMDHVAGRDVLESAFDGMSRWLRKGGVMSHTIDFSCPGGTPWNHHWAMSDMEWRIIRGRRPYYVNRVPLSEYLRLCERFGFRVLLTQPVTSHEGLPRQRLARAFRNVTDSDLETTGAHIIAIRV
jgi:hypothetical protein